MQRVDADPFGDDRVSRFARVAIDLLEHRQHDAALELACRDFDETAGHGREVGVGDGDAPGAEQQRPVRIGFAGDERFVEELKHLENRADAFGAEAALSMQFGQGEIEEIVERGEPQPAP